MESGKKNVAIELQTVIEDDGEKEYSTTMHKGELRRAGHTDVLVYEEDAEGGKIRSMVTIKPDSVSIKRSGLVGMHQKFQLHAITENAFQHPHGMIHMETKTNRLNYESDSDIGRLEITYTVRLNGQEERSHILTLQYQEEADAK